MNVKTGRFTTILAGAAVLLVVSVAFFLVFDLSIALGSSSELPIVRIAQKDAEVGGQGQTTDHATSGARAVGSTHSSSATDVGAPASSATPSRSDRTSDTTRKYVPEKVRVQDDPTGSDLRGRGNSRSSQGRR